MIPNDVARQIAAAYARMVLKAKYRPAAPSDGFGNIPPWAASVLPDEAHKYATQWWKDEDARTFFVGCCNHPTRPASIFALEAVRCMCAGEDKVARSLLDMALSDLRDTA